MSDANRYKLFNGLAKIKILSKEKFKYFFPHCINMKINCTRDCTFYFESCGIKQCKANTPLAIDNCNLKAGEKVKIVYNGNTGDSLIRVDWDISFYIENKKGDIKETLTVRGMNGKCKKGDIVGQFILPLISPYKYSNNIKQAYQINTKNINVSDYPEACRN